MIPGSNLLRMASSLIKLDTIQLLKLNSNAVNDIGIKVPVYDAPINIRASVQPVPRSLFQNLGLDWKKKYVTLYTENADMIGVERDGAGDHILFNGNEYQVESETEWRPIDGWAAFLCVEVQPSA